MILAGLVVALDLEWIEHPRASNPMTYVGLAAMIVATLALFIFLLGGVVNFDDGLVPRRLYPARPLFLRLTRIAPWPRESML